MCSCVLPWTQTTSLPFVFFWCDYDVLCHLLDPTPPPLTSVTPVTHQWITFCIVKEVVVGRMSRTSSHHPPTTMVSIPHLSPPNCFFFLHFCLDRFSLGGVGGGLF